VILDSSQASPRGDHDYVPIAGGQSASDCGNYPLPACFSERNLDWEI
jgi:hypothetical protein